MSHTADGNKAPGDSMKRRTMQHEQVCKEREKERTDRSSVEMNAS